MWGGAPFGGAAFAGDAGGTGTDFAASPAGIASALVTGVPAFAFGAFSVAPAGISGTLALGSPSFGFERPGGGGSVDPISVWAHTLANGLSAEQTLVEIHAWLRDLHQIHGLEVGAPLRVTPTSRSAGGVSQEIAQVGDEVSVTRQP